MRCQAQVKRAGNRFCSCSHAALARYATRPNHKPELGARERYRKAKAEALDKLKTNLLAFADEFGRISITAAMPWLDRFADERHTRGQLTAQARLRYHHRKLRMIESRNKLDEFLGTRFGKHFVTGELSPRELARFRFGGKR
jgi:hypothetical protein